MIIRYCIRFDVHLALTALLFFHAAGFSQDSLFVQRQGTNLLLGGRQFYAIGMNSYFLQNLSAYGDTSHVIEIFNNAQLLGVTVVRTWGFFDSPDSLNPAVMQVAPGRYNEIGLRALDFVVAKAKEHSLRLVIPFVNNWDQYGGMNQYVRWLADSIPFPREEPQEKVGEAPKVFGAGNRFYAVQVSGTLTHDDFYRHSTVMQWYKNYVAMLLNRVNVYTGRAYKDDPAILMWELANEPRSSDPSGTLIAAWVNEMSTFIKSIDGNHLVGTGEEGHDVSSREYSEISSFGEQVWLFNGTAGISFIANTGQSNIDVASIHCYPEDWGLAPSAAVVWMRDHQRIAAQQNKPLIVGEVGVRRQRHVFFDGFYSAAFTENVVGVLPWQFVYEGRFNDDGFAFSCPTDVTMCSIVKQYADMFRRKSTGTLIPPAAAQLYQNYPNPFNYVTAISFEIPSTSRVKLEVFDLLGRRVVTLADEYRPAGRHTVLFDAVRIASGVYIARFTRGSETVERKMILLK